MLRSVVQFIVSQRHFTVLTTVLLVLFGILSLDEMRVSRDPESNMPFLGIHFILPGSSPENLQKNVIFPAEKALRGIKRLIKIKSTISYGGASILLDFRYGVDMDRLIQEVESRINNIKFKLPRSLEYRVSKERISDHLSTFIIALYGEGPLTDETDTQGRRLVDLILQYPRFKNAKLVEAEQNIIVSLDVNRMHHHGISASDVTAAIESDNRFLPSGTLDTGGRSFRLLGPKNSYETVESITRTRLVTASGRIMTLGEIARVHKEAKGNDIKSRFDGRDAVFVQVGLESDSNVVHQGEILDGIIDEFRNKLPDGMKVEVVYTQAREVISILGGLLNSLVQGIVILMLVLLFSVGTRSALIITLLLPISLMGALFLLALTPFGLDQVTIGGFIIALGLMVDNGIVVTENAYLNSKYDGMDRLQAAVNGTSSAISPLLASTLTTMLAFMPIFMLTTPPGLFLRGLSVPLWFCLASSLFIAVTFATLLLANIGTESRIGRLPDPPSFLNALIPFRDGFYRALLRQVVRWRYPAIVLFMGLLIFAAHLAGRIPFRLFPPMGDPFVTVNLTFPKGATDELKREVALNAESRIRAHSGVQHVAGVIGAAFPLINLGMDPAGEVVFFITAHSGEEAHLQRLSADLRRVLAPIKADADYTVSLIDPSRTGSEKADFTLRFSGLSHDRLSDLVRGLEQGLRKIPHISRLDNPVSLSHSTLRVQLLQEGIMAHGMIKAHLDPVLSMLTYGQEVTRFRDEEGEEFPILVKLALDPEQPEGSLRQILVTNAAGDRIPLPDLARLTFEPSKPDITHWGFQPNVEVSFWVEPGHDIQESIRQAFEVVEKGDLPPSVNVILGGLVVSQKEDFQGLGGYTVIVAGFILAIFILQFQSFLQPLVVFAAVPFCVVGAMIALYLSGEYMSMLAALGVTSLMGIVVNDSILLVDEANHLRKRDPGQPLFDLVVEAGRKRFMPVLLTSVTTIAGLMPMALGSGLFKSMAIVIIGGLLSSTLLILFLVPALLYIFSPKTVRQ